MGYGAVFRVYCTFPYIEGKAVLNVKITIKWGKNQKTNRDWLVMMLGDVFRVQCALPNKGICTFRNER